MSVSLFPPEPAFPRVWHPLPFIDRRGRQFLVSFRIAEEATWDHRFHHPDGISVRDGDLDLVDADKRLIQMSCDGTVGSLPVRLAMPVANGNSAVTLLAAADATATA